MTFITKSWNNHPIRIRKDLYISLSDMAQANGKVFEDWFKLEAIKSYLKVFSTGFNIPIEKLIEIKEDGIEKGAWGHPKIALKFGQSCPIKFVVQIEVWIDELTKKNINSNQKKEPIKHHLNKQQIQTTTLIFNLIFDDLHIDKYSIAEIKLNAFKKLYPELSDVLEESRQLLIDSRDSLASPKKIGKLVGQSEQWVNKTLIDLKLQTKNKIKYSQRDPEYLPTEEGKKHSSFILTTDCNSSNMFQQLRWQATIIPLLQDSI